MTTMQRLARLGRVLPAIQHPVDNCRALGVKPIVNGIGKSLGEQTMKSEDLPVNTGVERQGINIRHERIQKICAQPFALPLVELLPRRQIEAGGREDADFHAGRLRKSALACSQSSTFS